MVKTLRRRSPTAPMLLVMLAVAGTAAQGRARELRRDSSFRVNGSVTIAVAEGASADVEISTVNGRFRSELALPLRRVAARGTTRFRLGSGGPSIRFATVNGDMRLVRQ